MVLEYLKSLFNLPQVVFTQAMCMAEVNMPKLYNVALGINNAALLTTVSLSKSANKYGEGFAILHSVYLIAAGESPSIEPKFP